MTTKPMFNEAPDGEYVLSAAAVLLLSAGAVYGDPAETTPEGRKNGKKIIDGILSAAVAGGFMQRGILETLLARNDCDNRTAEMARAACDTADMDALAEAIAIACRPTSH